MDARPVMYTKNNGYHPYTYENPNTLDDYVVFGKKQEPMFANGLVSMNVHTYRIQYKNLATAQTFTPTISCAGVESIELHSFISHWNRIAHVHA